VISIPDEMISTAQCAHGNKSRSYGGVTESARGQGVILCVWVYVCWSD